MNLDGTQQRKVIGSISGDTNPEWSPDGQQVAFESTRDGDAEIYLARIDGSDQRRLTVNPGSDTSPVWSPDGTRIAYVSAVNVNTAAETTDILVVNVQSGDISRASSTPEADFAPVWAPDGRLAWEQLGADGRRVILASRLDGAAPATLVDTPGDDSDLSFSPDGSRVAFVSDGDILVASGDGTGASPVISHPASDSAPTWSANGSRIAFVSDRSGSPEIHVVNPDGTGLTQLTDAPDTSEVDPRWRPGGQQ